jgi:hypothetical protein
MAKRTASEPLPGEGCPRGAETNFPNHHAGKALREKNRFRDTAGERERDPAEKLSIFAPGLPL